MLDLNSDNLKNYIGSVFQQSGNLQIIKIPQNKITDFFSVNSRVIDESNEDLITFEIDRLAEECCFDGWDNDSAEALSKKAVSNAKKFVRYIANFEIPDVNPYPNSDIGFQWNKEKDSLNIIFNKNNQIIFVKSKNSKVSSGFFYMDDIKNVSDMVKFFIEYV